MCRCWSEAASRALLVWCALLAGSVHATDLDSCRETFLYFAYGSNLLRDRIIINNPSAQFVGPAKLPDYRLDFVVNATLWRGAVATVAHEPGNAVWGALWKLNCSDMRSLDRQEGVDLNWYYPQKVQVISPRQDVLSARTYIQTITPSRQSLHHPISVDRRPSITYLKVIILGAIRCGIPENYVRYLHSIPHNGNDANPSILDKLRDLEMISIYPDVYTPR